MHVLPSPCYVLSDAHLGFAPAEMERRLIRFLRGLQGKAGSLVINGDLFEFWFEWNHVIPRDGWRVLAALADLRESGVPIMMIAGNHDCWGGDTLREEAGIEYLYGPWRGSLAGWDARLEHGDGLRAREDRRYRAMRAVIRHPWSIRAFRWFHPDWGTALASHSSGASRSYSARDGGAGLRAVAQQALLTEPDVEVVIYGHSHVASLERLQGGGIYANAGSWLDRPTYLRLTPERIELREDDGSAEGVHLHSLDHVAQEALP